MIEGFNSIEEYHEELCGVIDKNWSELLAKVRTEVANLLKLYFLEVNDETSIEGITWTQYTPYFNDGEECVFSIGDVYYLLRNEYGGYENIGIDDFNPRFNPNPITDDEHKDAELESRLKLLQELLHKNESYFQIVFGDHARVSITADNLRVERYDHE
ncbi:hypothetical protein H6G33_10660 [Calothrix sp. FACHB-1219]|uniref:hypothetical protein n=1 Tax=unclassified Calothrix TaxID=2619626 RepID=UPI00168240EC|nr:MULTISPECIES: hypothetical protein [unclassified Calothrix]MBD2201809.1 hypothetical protein [Calothrix sp. FACHB-168]MBD2217495.1 hypothetical protein [Calothrix sp. FACHB-1219]